MVRFFKHPASGGCQVRLKMWNFYAWLIISGFATEILCTDTVSGKQIDHAISSNDDNSGVQTHTEENVVDKPDDDDLHRILRAVPRIKPTTEPNPEDKSDRQLDYVVKIPLSVLRQLELYRLILLQEQEENRKYYKRFPVIPVPRYGRSGNKNENSISGSDNTFQYVSSEENLNQLLKEEADNSGSENRKSRSMLLLSAPKSEDTAKEKPTQTFVLPYPRPGRSNKHMEIEETSKYQLILPYPRPDSSLLQNKPSKMLTLNDIDKKYILPTARFGRSSLESIFGKEKSVKNIDDSISNAKYSSRFLKLNKEKISDTSDDENEENSLFVIPYPRPGKKTMFKLKNKNQEQKDTEKEITDYILPYPRPGKKSKSERLTPVSSNQKDTEDSDFQNIIHPYSITEETDENFSDVPCTDDFSDASNINENKFILPYLRTGRNYNNIVPYPRPGRSVSRGNIALDFYSDDIYPDSNQFQFSQTGLQNSKGILRYKRSTSAVSYPRLMRSNAVVPYPRLGRSNAVVPYPRLGRSNSVVPYPRIGRSDSVVPYPRLGRSSVVPYPRLGRSNYLNNAAVPYTKLEEVNSVIPYPFSGRLKRTSSVVPYPRLGRSNSLVPYPRPGRSASVVPYPRLGRAESLVPYPRPGRAESVVPYPRPGRSETIVPYPRPGRAESVVPYPRLGRSESIVPYPRPGRAEYLVPYPRPGRSDSIVPYPRPGRSNSLVPYPRPGRSNVEIADLSNKYGKDEKWLLPNLIPGRSNMKQEDNQNSVERIATNLITESSDEENNSKDTDTSNTALSEIGSISRFERASDGQGYVLPHPRIGRSVSHSRKKRESFDTDTVIPYPRLGRSQKETVPLKTPPETPNSAHKMNKHMLTSLEDSVYLLPYPRPGRYLE